MRFLDEDEELNPIVSAVNLVDVFLVIIAIFYYGMVKAGVSIDGTFVTRFFSLSCDCF